jgi:plastocyanin
MRCSCLSLLLALSLVPLGCGGDEADDDGETTDANDQSTGASSSSTGGGTTSDNECGADGYQAATEIAFGGDLGTTYSPRCVTIAVGGTVTWTGDFGIHPIVGGAIEDGQKAPDPDSPIAGATGMELVVTFDQAGTYPFYCDPHGTFGMNGAVEVE